MKPSQPSDEWSFLADDESVEPDERPDIAPELAALHAERDLTPAEDPGRAEVLLADEDTGAPRTYFDDEDPEVPAATDGEEAPEPDLESVLESQHYAFGPDDDSAE
jgi:hypothetical protein